MIAFHHDGCSFAIEDCDVLRLKAAIARLNVAIRIHEACTLVRLLRPRAGRLPDVARIMSSIVAAQVAVVHLAADRDAVSILFDARDAARAARALQHCAASEPLAS